MKAKILDRDLASGDPLLHQITELERERQARKIILIASESRSPRAVREALASDFAHIYAEGYPSGLLSRSSQEEIADFAEQLSYIRRYSNPRYYKGCEYADLMEALAKRRAAEAFASERVPAERIFANVQPLSGAAGNNAVYEAFLEPGDRVLGLTLAHGGHLTHGSPVNRSGKRYEVLSYEVHSSGQLDYDRIEKAAVECRPKLIIAGFSAYPWDLDWPRFREIADKVPEGGAVLLADIAHTAGLVAAGVVNNPVGYADVVSFTTHKSLCGPRGAALLCTDPDVAKKLNMAVFPGEQGGPHLHSMAAKAVAFGLAGTDEFKTLMQGVLDNARALGEALTEQGLTLAYGGTNTHMVLVDLGALKSDTGFRLTGEVASQILDLAHITCNKNTIRGDTNAAHPSAIRLGTVWATQRGFGTEEIQRLAELIARVLKSIEPFEYLGGAAAQGRGKLPAGLLTEVRQDVAELLDTVDAIPPSETVYPHFHLETRTQRNVELPAVLEVRGKRAAHLLHDACTADVMALGVGESTPTLLLDNKGRCLAEGKLQRLTNLTRRRTRFVLNLRTEDPVGIVAWLRELSDGYVRSADDLFAKVAGPAVIHDLAEEDPLGLEALEKAGQVPLLSAGDGSAVGAEAEQVHALLVGEHASAGRLDKAFFVGQRAVLAAAEPPEPHERFEFNPPGGEPRPTCLHEQHLALTTKHAMAPFAGWTMPMRYAGPAEEHRAVRRAAGLFDVSHMGVLEVTGPRAERFLDLVTTNYVPALYDGKAQYSYLLMPEGRVIDDILIYRRDAERYMVVVNAANAEEDEAWLRALNQRRIQIDPDSPHRTLEGQVTIRNLKDPAESGGAQRVDLALQGPTSLMTLELMADDDEFFRRIAHLRPFEFVEGMLCGARAIVSRTGYTGARLGFEIYVHPDHAPMVWSRALEIGQPFGVQPAGLAARDSTRTEAGLPLHGHELAGDLGISPIEAGYGGFVKLHKPFFIGRRHCLEQARNQQRKVVCFRLEGSRGRVPRTGSVVVDGERGRYAGVVTSIAGVDDRQFGLALVQARYAEPDTRLGIFPAAATPKKPAKWPAELEPGDQVALARGAIVLPRFPLSGRSAESEEEAE